MGKDIAKPFLKWAGGKGQLLDQIEAHLPKRLIDGKITKYVEPFLGGGAVFFYLISKFQFEKVLLNDINEEVILVYRVIQNQIDELIKVLSQKENYFLNANVEEREKIYYQIREEFNCEKFRIDYTNFSDMWLSHAANLIFLNKTCFNGLYRQNRKGEFNVPFGKYKNPTICNESNLRLVNEALQGVELLHGDFEELTKNVDENTFVYMDPPYRPLNSTSSFSDYSKEPFNDDSQRRLAEWFRLLNSKGASLMLSNSDPANIDPNDTFFEELYQGFTINRVSATRAINSKANRRGAITELLIVNEK